MRLEKIDDVENTKSKMLKLSYAAYGMHYAIPCITEMFLIITFHVSTQYILLGTEFNVEGLKSQWTAKSTFNLETSP